MQQRMWPGSDAKAVDLPPTVANRRLIDGAYLEEVMVPAQKSWSASFTRTAYFDYNPVNRQYEYFSLDSRAPQMMNERSRDATGQGGVGTGDIKLYGGRFVAPQWGDAKNVAFTYRLTIGAVKNNQQVVRLYLTPQSKKNAKEFLAFEYVYTRRQ